MLDGMNTYKLKNLASVQTGPFGSQLHQKDYVREGTPIITVEHLGENKILHNDLPCVCEQDRERLKKYSLHEGDIVFSRVGSVDRRAFVRKEEEGWLFSGRCLRIRPNPELINGKYLSYYFGLETFKRYIRGIAVGATMPSLNTNILNEIEIQVPPRYVQTRIAEILSSLEDKIELNLQMNRTLEAIAQAIFNEWFVEFRFPGFEGELIDNLPRGWRKGYYSELAKVVTGKGLKKEEYMLNGTFPVFGANGDIGKTDKYLFEDRLILTGRVGTLGQVYLSHGKCWVSDNVLISKPLTSYYYTYFTLKSINLLALNRGSTQPLITQSDLNQQPVICPEIKILNAFENITASLFNRITLNISTNTTLGIIKDCLLTKLMTGKIRVA
jgi:type I restriction enzyme S subunit